MTTVEIKTIRTYTRTNKFGVEKAIVCINDTIHLSSAQLKASGYSNPKAAIGNVLNVEYFAVGENLLNKDDAGVLVKCDKADSIVKSFTIEESAEDLRFAKMANAGLTVKL